MRHLILITLVFLSTIGFGQNNEVTTLEDDRIKKVTYYEDGSIREVGYFDLNERRHGKWVLYLENGNRKSVASFQHGLKDGEWIVYDRYSNIVCRMFYDMGTKVGTWEMYENGELSQIRNF